MATTNENPYLGEYEAYSAQATSAYQTALARITQQRGNYLQGYGLDASGTPVADNPFGAYQQFMGGAAQSAEESDAAGRGFGFTGGLSQQAQKKAADMIAQQSSQFGTQFQQGLGQLSEAEQDAGSSYNEDLYNKMLEISQRAAQDRAFNPPDYSGINYEPYGDQSPDPGAVGLPWKPPTNTQHRRRRRRRR